MNIYIFIFTAVLNFYLNLHIQLFVKEKIGLSHNTTFISQLTSFLLYMTQLELFYL